MFHDSNPDVVSCNKLKLSYMPQDPTPVRKSKSPGLHLEFIDSKRLQTIKLSMEHLQIDNQLQDAIIYTILAPDRPEKKLPKLPFVKVL